MYLHIAWLVRGKYNPLFPSYLQLNCAVFLGLTDGPFHRNSLPVHLPVLYSSTRALPSSSHHAHA